MAHPYTSIANASVILAPSKSWTWVILIFACASWIGCSTPKCEDPDAPGCGVAGTVGDSGGSGGSSGSSGSDGGAGAGGTGGSGGSGGAAGSSGAGGSGGSSGSGGSGGSGGSSGTGGASDGGVSNQACGTNTDCVALPVSCCGTCGEAQPADFIAVHKDRVGDVRNCDGVACPTIECARVEPRVLATCNAGQCEIVDLQSTSATRCSNVTECSVRAVECCECGAMTEKGSLIAVSDESAFTSTFCDPETACAECAPIYPSEARAICETEGFCAVVDTRPGI